MIKLIVSGRVGQDAELKTVGDTMVCSFSVAHTEKVYGPNPSEKVIWIGSCCLLYSTVIPPTPLVRNLCMFGRFDPS